MGYYSNPKKLRHLRKMGLVGGGDGVFGVSVPGCVAR